MIGGRRRLYALLTFTAAILLLSACRPQKSATIVPDPSLMPLVPADTTILASVRMDVLRETPVFKTLLADQKLPQLEAFRKETGIDLMKAVYEVVAVSNGTSALALVRGKFSEGEGMEPRIEREGIRRFAHKGYTLYGDERVAVTFFNRSVAVAGPTAGVRAVIDNRDGSKGGPPAALLDRMRAVPSSNQIYAIALTGFKGALPEELSGVLGGLRSLPIDIRGGVAALDLSNGVKLTSEIRCGDEKAAQKMQEAIRGVIGMARLSTPESQPEQLRFFDAIEAAVESSAVKVKADLPLDLLQKLLNLFADRRLG